MMKMMFPATRMNRSLGDFASDVNTLVDTLFGATAGQGAGQVMDRESGFTPRMDIHEVDDRFVVSVDLPGIKLEDVQIDLNEDDLVIHGRRHSQTQDQDERYRRVERWFGEFRRSIRLPRSVEREQISADYHNGVLTVWLPKSKGSASRKIEIRRGEANATSSPASATTDQQALSQ